MDTVEKIAPLLFISIAIVLMILFGYIATTRSLTELEVIVFQLLSLFAALMGSYMFGRRVSREKINEHIEPYARSAFRRLISLYQSLSRMAGIINDDKDNAIKLQIIEVIVLEQIGTANDALADWEDIVPKSVEELKKGIDMSDKRSRHDD